jgi:hypothetical protein
MFGIRASRPDSLGACKSGDPGSRGAMHARGLDPFPTELPGLLAFCVRIESGVAMSQQQSGGMNMFRAKQEIKAALHKTLEERPELAAKHDLSATDFSTVS